MRAPVGCESIGSVTRAAFAAVSRVCDERLKDRPVAMRPCERPLAGGGHKLSQRALWSPHFVTIRPRGQERRRSARHPTRNFRQYRLSD